ncbi:MAG: glycosyltransferase [Gemmatimonadota bacterium]
MKGTRPRLLILSYHFPPDGAVGGYRWAGISKYLARSGWVVDVVTAAPPAALPPEDGITVHSVSRRRTLNDAYSDWRRSSASPVNRALASQLAVSTAASSRVRSAIFNPVRKLAGSALAFPDHGRGWNVAAASVARGLLRERGFDAVVTTGPPHSTHLAGLACTIGSRVAHVVDMRDPWIWQDNTRPTSTALLTWMERCVVRNARCLVATTREFSEALRARFPHKEVAWIPNGVDYERVRPAAMEKYPGLSIAYAGSVYVGRDFGVVLRAMHMLFEKYPAFRGQCTLRVAGSMDGPHAVRFRELIENLGLQDSVIALGIVSTNEALDVISRSHLALVLAQNQALQIPAKLYECVALGVRTLVITEPDGATAREAARLGAVVCSPNADASVAALIEGVMLGRVPERAAHADTSYERIAARVGELLLRLSAFLVWCEVLSEMT